MRALRLPSIFTLIAMLAASPALATPGDLDSGFGVQGLASAGTSGEELPIAIARDGSGRIYVLNGLGAWNATTPPTRFRVRRYSPVGVVDAAFGSNGSLAISSGDVSYTGLAVDESRQRLLLSGVAPNPLSAVASRFGFDGGLDTTFGTSGLATLASLAQADAIALQTDGSVLVAGASLVTPGPFLARTSAVGKPDASFGEDGLARSFPSTGRTNNIVSIARDTNGRIVSCGPDVVDGGLPGVVITPSGVVISRFSASGARDTSFGIENSGTDQIHLGFNAACLHLQPLAGGEFAVAAVASRTLVLARVRANITLDPSFDGDGLQTDVLDVDWLRVVGAVAQDDGKLVLLGTSSALQPQLARVQGSPLLATAKNGAPTPTTGDTSGDGGGALDKLTLLAFATLGLFRRRLR